MGRGSSNSNLSSNSSLSSGSSSISNSSSSSHLLRSSHTRGLDSLRSRRQSGYKTASPTLAQAAAEDQIFLAVLPSVSSLGWSWLASLVLGRPHLHCHFTVIYIAWKYRY